MTCNNSIFLWKLFEKNDLFSLILFPFLLLLFWPTTVLKLLFWRWSKISTLQSQMINVLPSYYMTYIYSISHNWSLPLLETLSLLIFLEDTLSFLLTFLCMFLLFSTHVEVSWGSFHHPPLLSVFTQSLYILSYYEIHISSPHLSSQLSTHYATAS